ncbi:MAG: ATP cone domain-containing protein [Candidatus Nitrosotenuis sp.]
MNSSKYVIKADGSKVPFDKNKVMQTCLRAGASNQLANKIAESVEYEVPDGSTTAQVYRLVLNRLGKAEGGFGLKHRYKLKQAIMQMGPAGFPFESYISQILAHYGYEVEATRVDMRGRCGRHEVDVAAKKNNKRYMVECKYHHRRGLHTSMKDSLYTHARFLDLKDHFDFEMLACNTRLSEDAFEYANCIGQQMMCWKHPPQGGLEKMIEDKGLYPITTLNLNKFELMSFSQAKFMIAKDLLTADLKSLSKQTGISEKRLENLHRMVKLILR